MSMNEDRFAGTGKNVGGLSNKDLDAPLATS